MNMVKNVKNNNPLIIVIARDVHKLPPINTIGIMPPIVVGLVITIGCNRWPPAFNSPSFFSY